MLRAVVREGGQGALPAIDLEAPRVIIGSGPAAQVRLPADVARSEHVRIEGLTWTAIDAVNVDGKRCPAGERGAIGAGVAFELGAYRVEVAPAPPGTQGSPPQRTESLARELVRSLLGGGSAPSLEISRGPHAGSTRVLPPPEATVVIGRGDEATWVIPDDDLSRTHVEIRRGWDGITIRDLGSKNGTRVGGAKIRRETMLHDAVVIEIGNVTLVFHDPAERHLRGAGATKVSVERVDHGAALPPASPWVGLIAAVIAVLAMVGLIWVIAT